jgi:hypothetical protein
MAIAVVSSRRSFLLKNSGSIISGGLLCPIRGRSASKIHNAYSMASIRRSISACNCSVDALTRVASAVTDEMPVRACFEQVK